VKKASERRQRSSTIAQIRLILPVKQFHYTRFRSVTPNLPYPYLFIPHHAATFAVNAAQVAGQWKCRRWSFPLHPSTNTKHEVENTARFLKPLHFNQASQIQHLAQFPTASLSCDL